MYWWDVFSHLVQSWRKISRICFSIWWDDVWWTTVISSTIEVLHSSHNYWMTGQWKLFALERTFCSHRKKNLLFLPSNMAAVQNLYFMTNSLLDEKRQDLISLLTFKVKFCLSSPMHLTDSWSNLIFHLYCWPILFSCHRMQTILTTRLQISQKN